MKVSIIQYPVWGMYDPPIALAQLSACLKKAKGIYRILILGDLMAEHNYSVEALENNLNNDI
jgi:hypothetical protein